MEANERTLDFFHTSYIYSFLFTYASIFVIK